MKYVKFFSQTFYDDDSRLVAMHNLEQNINDCLANVDSAEVSYQLSSTPGFSHGVSGQFPITTIVACVKIM